MEKEKKKRKIQSIIVNFELKEENKKLGKKFYSLFHNFKEFSDWYNSISKIKRKNVKKITLNFVDGSFRMGKKLKSGKKEKEVSKWKE